MIIIPDFDYRKFYKGRFEYYDDKHLYTWDGVPKVSTTQLFSRVGVRKDEDSQFRSISGVEFIHDDTAAKFGSEFHKIPELLLQGKEADYDVRFEPWVKSLYMFLADHPYLLGDSRNLIECKLFSLKYGYAGTLDLFSFLEATNGCLYLIDWKTSVAIAKHYKWQLAAYTSLIKENFKIRKDIHTMTVQLKPDKYPQLETRKPSEVRMDFNKFLSILNTYNSI